MTAGEGASTGVTGAPATTSSSTGDAGNGASLAEAGVLVPTSPGVTGEVPTPHASSWARQALARRMARLWLTVSFCALGGWASSLLLPAVGGAWQLAGAPEVATGDAAS